MDIERTRQYYRDLAPEELCSCACCRSFVRQIRRARPDLAGALAALGVDAEKPLETCPLGPGGRGNYLYAGPQYVVLGSAAGFRPGRIGETALTVTEHHPVTGLTVPHFVIEASCVSLPWREEDGSPIREKE